MYIYTYVHMYRDIHMYMEIHVRILLVTEILHDLIHKHPRIYGSLDNRGDAGFLSSTASLKYIPNLCWNLPLEAQGGKVSRNFEMQRTYFLLKAQSQVGSLQVGSLP